EERTTEQGRPAGVRGSVEFATDLFDRETGRRGRGPAGTAAAFGDHRPVPAAEHPRRALPDERDRILTRWNATAHAVPDTTLPELFQTQAARTPQAIAVQHDDATLTYAELNTRANRLAHHLIGRGIGPEQYVALALPRSVNLVVAVLAVLKAGAAYLPSTPTTPPTASPSMLGNSTPACLLTDHTTAQRLPETPRPAAPAPGRRERHRDRAHRRRAGRPRPDGQRPRHRPAPRPPRLRHLHLRLHRPPQGRRGRTPLPQPLPRLGPAHLPRTHGADAGALAGRLRPHRDRPARPPHQWRHRPPHRPQRPHRTAHRPAHLRQGHPLPPRAARAARPGVLAERDLVLGGESLTAENLATWREAHPGATVINEYGPTEATVGCVFHTVEPGRALLAGAVSIGRPVWNTAGVRAGRVPSSGAAERGRRG
ncbi:AMP-binding protein, partial [Streptomyces tricolor]|nr:AMP-binding protein [Streptomyces tricolor]